MSRRDFCQHRIGRQNLAFNASYQVRSELVIQILGNQIRLNHWLSLSGIRQSTPTLHITDAFDKVGRKWTIGDLLPNLPRIGRWQSVVQIRQESS